MNVESAHTLLQNCIIHSQSQSGTDPDFHCSLWPPFFFINKQAKKKRYNFAEKRSLCIYLPVSSLKHHGKCTVSHKVLSAVLEVSNRLHCNGAATAADADDDGAQKRCSVASNVPSSSLGRLQSHSSETMQFQFW